MPVKRVDDGALGNVAKARKLADLRFEERSRTELGRRCGYIQ